MCTFNMLKFRFYRRYCHRYTSKSYAKNTVSADRSEVLYQRVTHQNLGVIRCRLLC